MAVDYFLQIAGIEGDSQDAKHKGWLDVLSWSWGESHPESPSPGGGGGGSGKVNMQDLSFMTATSKASPKLFLACAAGQHFKEAKLVGRKSGKDQQEYLTWTFSDILVSAFQVSASSEVPVESVSLSYAKVKLEYRPQKADGSLDAPITAGWDLKANKKL
jgi:type VI secretion system secreted protein Hcp